jgi:hypothetical protein
MITTIIYLLIFGLVLYLVYFIVGKFVTGKPLQIIGIILGLIFLLYALNALGIFGALTAPPHHL